MSTPGPGHGSRHIAAQNDLSGTVHGPVVQAATIHGGITYTVQQAPPTGVRVTPDEIPPLMVPFINRRESLAALDGWLTPEEHSAGVGFAVLHGPPGVGKTALVTRWAEQGRERFPGGQIYVDFASLRGETAGADISEAVRCCLRSLGVDEAYIPASITDRVRLLRSLSADRRLLIFLDNVSQPGQAAALIPKGKGSFLVVAGGSGLGELTLDGARLMAVEPLDRESALELLADRCGAEKIAADPASAERLVQLCDGLPVALHVVAGRLAARPRLTLEALAEELAAEPRRLAGMSLGKDRSVSAAFDLVYRELPPEPARLYRLMGWHPGATFDAGVAAVAAGLDPGRTAEALEALTGASLLEETPDGRFRFHDLVRLHAGDRATEEEGPAERSALLRRVTLHYLALTALADRAIRLDRLRIADLDQLLATVPDPFAAPGAPRPVDWLEAEHRNILGVLRAAAREEALQTEVWQLAEAFTVLFLHHRHLGDWRESLELGAAAAAEALVPAAEARLRSLLSRPLMDLGEYDAARRELDTAQACAEVSGDLVVRASVQEFSGRYWDRNDPVRAMEAYRSALDLNTAANEGRGAAIAAYFLGCAQDAAGDPREALDTLRGAHDQLLARKDLRMAARVRVAIGIAHDHLGETDEAVRALREGAADLRDQEATHYEAHALVALADIQTGSQGDPQEVRTHLERALEIYEAGGSPRAQELRQRLAGGDAAG
ncbi:MULTISPECIES: NB-ARC domain-containing protein [unclassified Streptomyces]|uniref:NB-ARC domain-containing protein n=1 Tax=unclassified Streptomyces TaxID=2593676 RepID=UPI00081DA5D6|nr:NB-ARC domain-containing protein [Streptomyces sp. ScaeMP-e83]SCE36439.1 NB-ARC domain-containing protein [Streptomyces sp. ScaeMP-e83]